MNMFVSLCNKKRVKSVYSCVYRGKGTCVYEGELYLASVLFTYSMYSFFFKANQILKIIEIRDTKQKKYSNTQEKNSTWIGLAAMVYLTITTVLSF